jgi:hypothetical protein
VGKLKEKEEEKKRMEKEKINTKRGKVCFSVYLPSIKTYRAICLLKKLSSMTVVFFVPRKHITKFHCCTIYIRLAI